MKRVNLKTVLVISFVAIFVGNIFAQRGGLPLVPLYLEHYNQRTGNLESKMWNNEKHIRVESIVDGKTQVMIYRSDSTKAYMVDDVKKTLTIFPAEKLIKTFDIKNTDEFIGKETIEGFECEHYRTKITETSPNGQISVSYRDSWWYVPYKMEIMSKEEGLDAVVSRNIKLGAQPSSLFELPKDYKIIDLNTKMKDVTKMLEGMQNNQNKTQEQKMEDMMKMLEGLNKKK